MAGTFCHFLLGYFKNRAIETSISLLPYPPEVQICMKYKEPKVNLYHDQLALKRARVSDVSGCRTLAAQAEGL